MSSIPLHDDPKRAGVFDPWGIESTTLGVLLVSCNVTHSIYSVEAKTGAVELIAGSGDKTRSGYVDGDALREARFKGTFGLLLNESEACLYVADRYNCVVRVFDVDPCLIATPHYRLETH